MASKLRRSPSKSNLEPGRLPDSTQTRDSVRTHIKQTLLERIVNGTYLPGQRLKELEIAREFLTSQAPVREALRELEAVGLIETKYYQGSRVRVSSQRELEQAYEIRASLEELAAHSAASALQSKTKSLKRIVDKLTILSAKGEWQAFTRYNYLFHRSIVAAAGNSLLLQVWDSLHFEFRTRLAMGERTAPDLKRITREHYEIIEALDRGDGQRAGRLLRAHCLENIKTQRRDAFAHGANHKSDKTN